MSRDLQQPSALVMYIQDVNLELEGHSATSLALMIRYGL